MRSQDNDLTVIAERWIYLKCCDFTGTKCFSNSNYASHCAELVVVNTERNYFYREVIQTFWSNSHRVSVVSYYISYQLFRWWSIDQFEWFLRIKSFFNVNIFWSLFTSMIVTNKGNDLSNSSESKCRQCIVAHLSVSRLTNSVLFLSF